MLGASISVDSGGNMIFDSHILKGYTLRIAVGTMVLAFTSVAGKR